MANEISVGINITGSKNGQTASLVKTVNQTLTGNQLGEFVQTIGASDELLVFPADALADGISFVTMRNTHSLYSVSVGAPTNTTNQYKMKPGQCLVLSLNKAAGANPSLYAVSDTAGADLAVVYYGT